MDEEELKKQKEMQEKFVEFQVNQQQMAQIQQQLQKLTDQKGEVEKVKDALNDISKVTEGKEILAPLTSGIFIKAKLTNSSELLVNVGTNVVVKKTIPEVIQMLEEQENEIIKMEDSITRKLQELAKKVGIIEKELDVMIQGAKNV